MGEKNCKLCFHYDVCYAARRIPERAEGCSKYAPDVVEVVRCKDCNYNDKDVCIHPDNITHSYDCEENIYDHYINVYSDHFCSYGERRTDNDV